MGFATYRPTLGPTHDDWEPRRTERHDWAAAWTMALAPVFDGLTVLQRQEVYRVMHEIRRRIEAGDYGPPDPLPPRVSKPQGALKLEP